MATEPVAPSHDRLLDPPGFRPPDLDVTGLARLLDGRYAEVRDLGCTTLVTYASVLDEAETMGCDLFALTTIEADRAWFMEPGRLSSARSKAITREVNDLCRKIRPLAQGYVDALGVPRELLRAPDLVAPTGPGPA